MNLFEASPKIYFGEHALDYLYQLPREKVLLVTDPFMVSSGMVKTVTGRLDQRGIDYAVFSEVAPDPSISAVAAGLRQVFVEKPDTVIALGGGSAIDLTKAMLYFCVRVKGVMMDTKYIHHPNFIAIPTTSGTGSEVTSYAVISDPQRGVKIPLSDKSMIPDVAILDPEYTKTLPAEMAAFTGMDVMTHALEAFVSDQANDFTNPYACEAAKITLHCLPEMVRDSADDYMRERMFSASTMAGIAFTNASLGLCHGIAHTMGAQYHIPHGKANAVILPYIIAFNGQSPVVRSRYEEIARYMGLIDLRGEPVFQWLLREIIDLNRQFGIPLTLKDCGVEREAFLSQMEENIQKILEDICTQANPVPAGAKEVRALLLQIYDGGLDA